MKLRVSSIISQLFRVIVFAKYALTILELNWNKRFRDNKTKLNVICHHLLTSSTQQLQNRSFHAAERTRTSAKCQNVKNARAKRAKLLFFHCQICKFVTFLLPSSSWLLKSLGPVSRKSRNSSGAFRVTYFHLYLQSERRLEARNFAVLLLHIPFTTYEKASVTEKVGRSFTSGFSGSKKFAGLSRNGPLVSKIIAATSLEMVLDIGDHDRSLTFCCFCGELSGWVGNQDVRCKQWKV